MVDRGEIKSRIRQLLCEELDRRIHEAQQRRPHLCAHNWLQPLDSRKEVYGETNDQYNRIAVNGEPVDQTIGLCMLGAEDIEQWKGAICEDDVDAMKCPYFQPTRSKRTLWNEFLRDVADPAWVASNMPAVRELLWVLDESPSLPALVPWWKALWYRWVLRIQIVPIQAVTDFDLLPPGPDAPALLEMQDGDGRLVQIRRSKNEDVSS